MKKKVRKYVVIVTLVIVLGILSFMMYQSYAYFKVNYTGNIINTVVGAFGSYEYGYTGSVQEFVVPAEGYYEIELWGAQGGHNFYGNYPESYRDHSLGGYTVGTIYLEKDEELYLCIGNNIVEADNANGLPVQTYNGGGLGGNSTNIGYNRREGAAGGATDVRLVKASSTDDTIWNESASLRSRIMVAGGGGGTDGYGCHAGHGGGLIAETGLPCRMNDTYPYPTSAGYGATQITSPLISGGFGYGGNGQTGFVAGGSGGGGYYGGGGGNSGDSVMLNAGSSQSGGGGSSYISGYSGVNSIQETGGTAAQPFHTNNTIHYSGKYFINGSMEAGVNSGNGKAKITYIGTEIPERTNTKLDDVRYIKNCVNGNSINANAHWAELQAIKDGNNLAKGILIETTMTNIYGNLSTVTDGNISMDSVGYSSTTVAGVQCVTLDLGQTQNLDEIGLWHAYDLENRKYIDNILTVSADKISWKEVYNYQGVGYAETSQGKRYTAWD